MSLTEISVRNLKPPISGQVTLYDETLPGFGVRVSQGGTKSFVLVYGQNRQRMTIGRYPIISLADARTEAKRLLAENTLGKHRPKTIAFDDAKALFLAECKQNNRPKTVYDYTRLLNRHFKFGRDKLNEIATADISKKLNRIKAQYERRYATVVIKRFFNWAYRQGYVETSPAARLQTGQPNSRSRVLTDAELSHVWTATADLGHFGAIVKLLILTGQRRGEIAALQAKFFKDDLCTLPASLTKNKREHTFPFSFMASSLLRHSADGSDGSYIFGARGSDGGKPFNGWSKSKAALDKLCGVTGWTLHDLRRTFKTNLSKLGVAPHISERLLNHVSARSPLEDTYNLYAYLPEMRGAMRRYEEHLGRLFRVEPERAAA